MQRVLRHGALIVGLCGLIGLCVGPASASASSGSLLRGYAVTISPSGIGGGATTNLTVTIKDEMLLIPIQSADLFVPAGLSVKSVSFPAGSRAKGSITTCKHGTVSSQCVQVTNLGILPLRSLSFTISVLAAPGCSGANLTWGVAARPDALISLLLQLLGLGNLPLDAANSSLTTAVTDSCHLQFVTEPNNVIVGQLITGSSYNAGGPPVVVDVLDASNAPVAGQAVTVALANNPSGAVLGGTLTQTTNSSGAATFADLTVNDPGTGYTMSASSGTPSTTSTPFDAQNQASTCSGQTCSTSTGNTQGTAQITATGPGGTSGTLTESVNVPNEPAVTCGSYVSADPNTYDFMTTNSSLNKVVTITITSPQGNLPPYDPTDTDLPDGDGDYDDVLSTQQICFQAPYDFEVAGGGMAPSSVVGGTTVFTGLLPSCNDPNTGPCHDRSSDSVPPDPNSPTGYDIILVADLPAAPGDPRMN